MTVMEALLIAHVQVRELPKQIFQCSSTMTELMLGERSNGAKGLAVCAHHAQRIRADGFTLIVKVSGNKNRVKTETSLALNFGGDGPFADTSPNQDLMTVPQGGNGLEGC